MDKSSVIQIHEGQVHIGSWDLCKILPINHKALKGILRRHKSLFDKESKEPFPIRRHTGKKGGQVDEFLLTAQQTRLLMITLSNSPRHLRWKRICLKPWKSDVDFFSMIEYLSFEQDPHPIIEE